MTEKAKQAYNDAKDSVKDAAEKLKDTVTDAAESAKEKAEDFVQVRVFFPFYYPRCDRDLITANV